MSLEDLVVGKKEKGLKFKPWVIFISALVTDL